MSPEEVASRLQAGVPTVDDILDALARPGRDPREDLPPPIFKKGVLKLEDLQPGMELKGTVLNVVDFGAFIDIGLKDSGLVHISQMANRYVKSPYDVAAVGDVVTVWVLAVDKDRRRVSLTMIQPGTERKPPEKKPQPPRREGPPPARRPPHPEGARAPRKPAARRAATGARPARGKDRDRGEGRNGAAGRRRRSTSRRRRAARRRPMPAGQQQYGRGPAPITSSNSRPRAQGRRGRGAARRGRDAAGRRGAATAPPRKPRRTPPKPNLSQAALAGATPLGTFAELAAFWEAKKKEDEAPQAAVQPPAPDQAGETPPPA